MEFQKPRRYLQQRFWSIAATSILLGFAFPQPASTEDSGILPIQVGKAIRVAMLANEDITESSGIAISQRLTDTFWTHNDSGDSPRLFAFDSKGKDLGACELRDAEALDWEDITSFKRDGKGWLLV